MDFCFETQNTKHETRKRKHETQTHKPQTSNLKLALLHRCSVLISQKTFAGTIATGARVFVWGACDGAKRLARVTVCGTVVATGLMDGQCASSQDFTGYALQGLPLESYCADDQVLF